MAEAIYEDLLESALYERSALKVQEIYDELHPADLAPLLEELDAEERQLFFDLLGAGKARDILEYLSPELVAEELASWPNATDPAVLNALSDDTLADVLRRLDQPEREQVLPLLAENKRRIARQLLSYPDKSAGSRMTTEFAVIPVTATVGEAKALLVGQKDRAEILARIFVVDDHHQLLGKVRLRDLAFSPDATPIASILDDHDHFIEAGATQEEAAQLIAKYDLIALPVVNPHHVLIGIITHDDALDILQQESTEDLERFMAISPAEDRETEYLEMAVWEHFKRRVTWLIGLAGLGLISGYVIYSFEEVLASCFILAIYMPMLAAAGGNTGSQSATLVIRAMSLGVLQTGDALAILWKEIRVGLMLGAVLGIFAFLKVIIWPGGHLDDGFSLLDISLVVSLALAVQVLTSAVMGGILPVAARAARLDPAVVASPAITTCVDVSGLLIYFTVARLLLGL